MKKTWFNIFMGLFILLFAGLCITGGVTEARSKKIKKREHHKHHYPYSVEVVGDIVAIEGGGSHTIELKSDGTVWVWGSNKYGQLGDGTTIDSPAPIQVSGLTEVIAIAGGGFNSYSPLSEESAHTIALKSDGTVWTWGDNSTGQLGDGTTTDSTTPIQVNALTNVIAISAGSVHSVALKNDGTVWTWGNNKRGQLGVTTTEECEFELFNRTCSTTPVQVPDFTDVIAIAGGGFHTVALKSDGTVWSTTSVWNTTPVELIKLTDVIAIAAGGDHTLALKTDGTVWAWGGNSVGQLGDGTTADDTTANSLPVQVSGLADVIAIAAGGNNSHVGHSLALKNDGTVWAWGANGNGQLGGTTTEICGIYPGKELFYSTPCSPTAVQISDLTDVTAVSAGWLYSIVLKNDGTVWAWGSNIYGQLGVTTTETCDDYAGSFDCSPTPVPVRSKTTGTFSVSGTVSSLTGTLVFQNNGGDDLTITENGPFTFATELEDLDIYDITILTQPFDQRCSVNSGRINAADVIDIEIKCFTFAVIAAGSDHSIAIETDGKLWTWGDNLRGQLGDGTTTSSSTPVEVSGLTDVTAIAGGGSHTVALKNDGTVWVWGYNYYGQLGTEIIKECGFYSCSTTPVQVSGLTDVTAIAAGENHTFALKNDGTVWAWGDNSVGQLGDGTTTNSSTPVQLSGIADVDIIATGPNHTVVLKSDGTVLAWGDNRFGQLGVETTETCEFALINGDCSTTPVQISGLTDVAAIATGDSHTIVLKADGTVWAWGENTVGQLGNGTTTNSIIAVQVSGLTDVITITASIALKNDGTIWAWGENTVGQLGVETTETCINSWGTTYPCSTTPVQVSWLANVIAIETGDDHTIALKTDGTVWAWGYNNYGQLGDGTRDDRFIPVQVVTP